MVRIPRRRLLKLSVAGAIAARTGGIAAILASGRAPAYGQVSTVHYLRWSDFVPASDQLLKTKIAPECEKALGIKLTLEMVNANDIQARITSAVQSGSGPDIIMVLNIWPQLYADSVADVGDVAEEIGKGQGGVYAISRLGRKAAFTRSRGSPLPPAGNGSASPGPPAAVCSPIARPGSKKSAIATRSSRKLGKSTARPVSSSKPRAVPSVRHSATLSAMPRASGILTCGRGAARRSRPTARRWR